MRCLSRLVALSFRITDTKEERTAKKIFVPVILVLSGVTAVMVSADVLGHRSSPAYIPVLFSIVHIGALVLAYSPWFRKAAYYYALTCAACLMVADLVAASRLISRVWSVNVLLLDLCLVLNLRLEVAAGVLTLAVLYTIVERLEASTRFGLYRMVREGGEIDICSCLDPPCATGVALGVTTVIRLTAVLLMDFLITRMFARQTRAQLRTIQATADVSEKVAAHLSRYEVEAAEEAVTESAEQLPAPMLASYRRLVANLKFYRRFLPQSCLLPLEEGDDGKEEEEEQQQQQGGLSAGMHGESTPSARAMSLAHSPPVRVRWGNGSPGARSTSRCGAGTGDQDFFMVASPVQVSADMRKKRVALLCTNRTRFLDACRLRGLADLREWMAEDVGCFAADVASLNGCVDLVAGDHRFASFGAVRSCPRSANRAVTCAARGRACSREAPAGTAFHELAQTSAVVHGIGVCGDFGSSSLQRFMVIGGLPAQLTVLERLAAKRRVPVLIGEQVRDEVYIEWQCEPMGQVVYEKRGSAKPMAVFTLRELLSPAGDNEEWMYALDKSDVFEPPAGSDGGLVTVLADVCDCSRN